MKSIGQPNWYRVLEFWQRPEDEGGRGKTGLSFSLLVGVMQAPVGAKFSDDEQAIEFSRNLYSEMLRAATPCGRKVITYACPGIIRGTGIQLANVAESDNKSFEDLWSLYGQAICDGKYSIYLGKFSEICDKEREWILDVLS